MKNNHFLFIFGFLFFGVFCTNAAAMDRGRCHSSPVLENWLDGWEEEQNSVQIKNSEKEALENLKEELFVIQEMLSGKQPEQEVSLPIVTVKLKRINKETGDCVTSIKNCIESLEGYMFGTDGVGLPNHVKKLLDFIAKLD